MITSNILTFEDHFYDAVDRIELEAAELGMSVEELSRSAGVADSTIRRWRRQVPRTVRLVTRMQEVVLETRVARVTPTPGRKVSPRQKLDNAAGSSLRSVLLGGRKSALWEGVMGVSTDEIRRHFERQFLPGMNWSNIRRWHADHIVPRASFTYSSYHDPEFRRAWSLTNLRPLWARDNILKGSRREHLL